MNPLIDIVTKEARILCHFIIPGQPVAQKRVSWNKGKSFDPSWEDKKAFGWQLKATYPRLRPDFTSRLGIRIECSIGVKTVRVNRGRRAGTSYEKDVWNEDADNFAKFYMDCLKCNEAKDYGVWGDDRQVDELQVYLYRSAPEPQVEIIVWEIGDGRNATR